MLLVRAGTLRIAHPQATAAGYESHSGLLEPSTGVGLSQ
jgi:hypothetical protein